MLQNQNGLKNIMVETIGILMAGGDGSRLGPLTKNISKHLLPIYDKPMIYYSLSTLMLSGIKNILIVGKQKDIEAYKILFDDGAKFGMKINYILQPIPKGIPEAFILSEKYIKNKNVCLILGDNFFYGNGLSLKLINLKKKNKGATILGFKVQNPSDYGVIKLKKNKIINIIEKPKTNISNYAVTGLYFFDKNVVDYTYKLKPSKRGELEITDLNKIYLSNNKLNYEILDRGFTWLDTGNPEYLLKATQFVNILEERQGVKIACIEEIAYRNNWISKKDLKFITKKMNASNYKDYLVDLVIKG